MGLKHKCFSIGDEGGSEARSLQVGGATWSEPMRVRDMPGNMDLIIDTVEKRVGVVGEEKESVLAY